ncbi:hypothetical protein E2C01_089102 [Portunus trituberculatus]|uniref:Uncharacterized protein n=1 Tax=Portunus trituberculatus TaxID=210409 RepID=A0A5B7JNN5_PORTR|nr:hypothetical protein [Portunus trituberculatus]
MSRDLTGVWCTGPAVAPPPSSNDVTEASRQPAAGVLLGGETMSSPAQPGPLSFGPEDGDVASVWGCKSISLWYHTRSLAHTLREVQGVEGWCSMKQRCREGDAAVLMVRCCCNWVHKSLLRSVLNNVAVSTLE